MKMYIPEIGDKIKLTADWTFRLFDERRNEALIELLGLKNDIGRHLLRTTDGKKFFMGYGPQRSDSYGWYSIDGERFMLNDSNTYRDISQGKVPGMMMCEDDGTEVTLKAGQVLTIDRIYIRRGASEYSSITFNYIGAPKGSGRVRFWAKLADVNTLEFEQVE